LAENRVATPCERYGIVSQPEIAIKSIKTPIITFKVIQGHCSGWQSKARVRLPISD